MDSCSLIQISTKPSVITADDSAFMERFEQRVEEAIRRDNLFKKGDNVLVAVSGGKDSTVLLYVLHKLGYSIEAVTVDVHIGCYTEENLARIKVFCAELGVKLHVTSFKEEYGHSVCYLKDAVREQSQKLTSCTVCGVLRRNVLNRLVREEKAAVIATGHNLDDEAGSVWMNFLRNKMEQCSWLGPGTSSNSSMFIRRVKPLYFISEKDIIRYSKLRNFNVGYSPCPCGLEAFRASIKDFFRSLSTDYPEAMENTVKFFIQRKPFMQEYFQNSSLEPVRACEGCGEPAKDNLCRTCKILNAAES